MNDVTNKEKTEIGERAAKYQEPVITERARPAQKTELRERVAVHKQPRSRKRAIPLQEPAQMQRATLYEPSEPVKRAGPIETTADMQRAEAPEETKLLSRADTVQQPVPSQRAVIEQETRTVERAHEYQKPKAKQRAAFRQKSASPKLAPGSKAPKEKKLATKYQETRTTERAMPHETSAIPERAKVGQQSKANKRANEGQKPSHPRRARKRQSPTVSKRADTAEEPTEGKRATFTKKPTKEKRIEPLAPIDVPMTPKERALVREFLKDNNATQAAIRAGYNPKSAVELASRALRKVNVAAAVERGRARLAQRADIEADRVIQEYAAIALADVGDYVVPDGHGGWRLDLENLSPAQRAAIKELSPDGTIKFHDKIQALDRLGKHLGLFKDIPLLPPAPERAEVTQIINNIAIFLDREAAAKASGRPSVIDATPTPIPVPAANGHA